ncbi:glycopeptide [Suillus brevipes Sb2]|nr:glycopeptide [Suillus brevipes Sb2]
MPAFMAFSVFFSFFLGIFSAMGVGAETHTIKFINQCGRGTPCLVVNAQNVSTGQDYVANGIFSAIAYLQTGECNVNGEECTLLEMNLANPTCPGCGSSVDISLIDPHRYNVETSFAYYNGCDGFGADCNNPSCAAAFYAPEDWYAQRQCEVDNFCHR